MVSNSSSPYGNCKYSVEVNGLLSLSNECGPKENVHIYEWICFVPSFCIGCLVSHALVPLEGREGTEFHVDHLQMIVTWSMHTHYNVAFTNYQ